MATSFLVMLSHNRTVVMWKSTFGKVREQLEEGEEASDAYSCEISHWKLKRCSCHTRFVTIQQQQQETNCCLICQEGATFIWRHLIPAVISSLTFFWVHSFIRWSDVPTSCSLTIIMVINVYNLYLYKNITTIVLLWKNIKLLINTKGHIKHSRLFIYFF